MKRSACVFPVTRAGRCPVTQDSLMMKSAYLKKVRLFFCLRRAVPGDTWRAHFASPRRAGHSFNLRADACRFDIGEADRFFVLPDGTQEASAASLLGITAPRGAFPASGLHPLNVRTTEVLHCCSISSGPTADGTSSISPFARWINRAIPKMSSSVSFVARSTPRMQIERVSLFDSVEARSVQRTVRLGSSTCLLHLCW